MNHACLSFNMLNPKSSNFDDTRPSSPHFHDSFWLLMLKSYNHTDPKIELNPGTRFTDNPKDLGLGI